MEEKKILDTENTSETVLTQEELHGESLNDRVKVLSPTRLVVKRFFRSKLSVVGLIMLIGLFLFSFVGPMFSPWTGADGKGKVEDTTNITARVDSETIQFETADGETFEVIDVSIQIPTVNKKGELSSDHWLGTDEKGWDLFTRLMLGGRISLTIGFVVIILETLIGVILGGLAGYFGGWVDSLIMRIVDILNCIPTIPIMLILSRILQENGMLGIERLYYLMLILTLFGWAGTARLVRGQILSLREQEFMLAAKCAGLSTRRKIFTHLIPNVMPQLIVSMTLGLGSIILTEATLGFLGLGAPLDTATWGALIQYATEIEYLQNFPNFWLPAGVCITLAILAFNFVGDGLRDAFDPKMKR
ncbi:MAG: ABC transporter permease [Clostridia bacterium]|nr:ABC transporter permease [Clostridia bacterium]